MITGIYEGGLGNLMFQIAAGICLALDNQDIYKLNPNRHIGRGQGNHISNYTNNIFSKIEKTDFISNNVFEHMSNTFKPITYTEDICLRGYFQNFNYICQHQKHLKETFNFDYIEFNKIREKKILTIHIRTGDYTQYEHFNIITKKYYENCLNKIDIEEYEIFLISDYPQLAQKYLPDIPYKIFHKSEIEDMFLMSESDVCIISNSTFAWWGSFLGREKIIYAPFKWNLNDEEFKNIYTDNMVKVDF